MNHSPVWLFDLNNTLHNAEVDILYIINRAMTEYMAGRLKLSEKAASHLRQDYQHRYGATLAGLQIHHPEVDIDELLRESHPLKQILAKVEGMDGADDVLSRLKGRRAVFSNEPSFYIRALVEALGLEAHFDGLFGTSDPGLLYKPNPQTYLNICRLLGAKPKQCTMVDGSADSLHQAKTLGIRAVWYGEKTRPLPFAGGTAKDMQGLLESCAKLPWNF